MLDLVRLSRRSLFPPGGRELYHQIALLTELSEGSEVLVASCGRGTTLAYFVEEFGVHGEGVDGDAESIEIAEAHAKREGLGERLHFQRGSMDDLPYRDGVFDVAVGEVGLTARADPEKAVAELVRVTKAGGRVVLVQLVWKAPVEPRRQTVLSRHLGARPLMLVELKRILRAVGVERLHTEAWSDEDTAFRSSLTKPFPDFAEMFTLREKLGILQRARRRWGWRGVQAALARELEVHRLLTRERILGLDLITGWKTADVDEGPPSEDSPPHAETVDLPLFLQGEQR
jgi:ubiquinone/menaquinone biosynthesis C-methylase UbiE